MWIYCLSWAFDYRATEDGGSLFQYACFGLSLASAAGVALIGWKKLFVLPTGKFVLGWGLYLAASMVVMLVNGVEFGWYARNIIPPLLVLTSLMVVQVAAGMGLGYRCVLIPMMLAGVVNVIWKGIYSLVIAGIPMDMIRVEMLSQCLPFIMGYLLTGLLLGAKLPKLALIAGGIGLLSYMISITRTAFFIIGAAGIGAAYGLWRCHVLRVLPKNFWNAKTRHALWAIGGLVVILILVGATMPIIFERWYDRLFKPLGSEYVAIDPSALTRLAETQAFYDLLNQEPATWIYGRGVGYPYYWDEKFIPELMYTYGDPDVFRNTYMDVRFPGHSIWTYATFSGGIAGLLWYVWLLFGGLRQTMKCLSLLPYAKDFPLEVAVLPLAGLFSYISESLTSNPFIERTGGLVVGILIAFPQFLYVEAYKNGGYSNKRQPS